MLRFFVIIFFVISSLFMVNPRIAFSEEKRVLLVSAYHPGFPTFFTQIEGLKSVLDPVGVKLDVEFMDSKRFYNKENINAFHNLLKLKLSSLQPYDVVVTSDDNALKFALEFRGELFPETPVVFCGVNNQEMARVLNNNDDFTGVIEAVSLDDTLAIIPRLFPMVKSIYAIVDSTPSGQGDLELYKDAMRDLSGIKFIELSLKDLSWSDLRFKLENIPPESAVILLSAYRDKNLITKSFDESLKFILAYCRFPVFHHYEHGMGDGMIGGKILSHFEQGQIAGTIVLDIINGKAVDSIPVVEGVYANKYTFDRKVLERFNVKNSRLPKGARIINEEKTFYAEYRFEILGLSLFFAISFLFSIILLFYYIRLRKTEEKVRKSEERFAFAMDANRDGLWDWNIVTDEVYYSPGYKAMLGYGIDEVPFHVDSWLDLIHEDDRGRAFAGNTECIENEVSNFEVEFRMQAKNGEWLWILGRGNAIKRDEQGRALRMIGTHTDITERKRSEEEIRILRNSLKSIIDSMPFVLIGLDSQGVVTQWNLKAVEVTGATADDAVGRSVEEVFPRLLAQRERIEESLMSHKIYIDTRVSRHEKGVTRYDDVTIYPFSADDGLGVVVLVDDVTERVHLEEMVVHNEKMLSVGGLAAGMAHEINNPLGAILQGTQNIQRRALGELSENYRVAKQRNISLSDVYGYLSDRDIPKILNGINSAAIRAAKIVSNMLSFSRKNEDNFKEHNLGELLDEVVDIAANEYNLTSKYDFRKIKIIREYDENTSLAYCERSEVQQVFLNLLTNSAQSMNGKEYGDEIPSFKLRIHSLEDNVIVEIEDNGVGINEDVRKRIFEPFYTTKQVGEGTGLGLAISYFIITDLHKGKMEVLSSPGRWTRFIITLPQGRSF